MKRENIEIIFKIIDRAAELDLLKFDRLSLFMDIECAVYEFNLRLNDLLVAPQFDFVHDVCGIQANINRSTKKFENCFLPRYSA